eukprot:TRINITY_DN4030_c0_g1_i1.p1 TRINITY_DN4030_c0_g1~~TRINITY_DN4030_c0_g1_i1.p1  ORF type:complete len:310 (-),score=57.84 TRINITY_DN4030_c0_g1_i1:66-947(-)
MKWQDDLYAYLINFFGAYTLGPTRFAIDTVSYVFFPTAVFVVPIWLLFHNKSYTVRLQILAQYPLALFGLFNHLKMYYEFISLLQQPAMTLHYILFGDTISAMIFLDAFCVIFCTLLFMITESKHYGISTRRLVIYSLLQVFLGCGFSLWYVEQLEAEKTIPTAKPTWKWKLWTLTGFFWVVGWLVPAFYIYYPFWMNFNLPANGYGLYQTPATTWGVMVTLWGSFTFLLYYVPRFHSFWVMFLIANINFVHVGWYIFLMVIMRTFFSTETLAKFWTPIDADLEAAAERDHQD